MTALGQGICVVGSKLHTMREILPVTAAISMRLIPFVFTALMLTSVPAAAERLQFNHRLHPQVKAVLDSGRSEMVSFDASDPKYLVDRIVVEGKSVSDWTEEFEIIARSEQKGMNSAADWLADMRRGFDRRCANTISVIAQDYGSITFERHTPSCPAERAESGIYRIVAGKHSLFLLAALRKGPISDESKRLWLALLASAHLE